MLGRASWMRLPDIVGVELTGKPQPGITATDVVLALTEFLRKEKVVGAYLEFHGEGAAALTLGDRATISNMAPEYGATAAMFFIDEQTIDYLRLTGREDAQVQLVETYAKARRPVGRQPEDRAVRARAAASTCPPWCATWPARPTRIAASPTTDLAARGIAGHWRTKCPGLMPDGAVIIAAITSCTNTSNPRNVIAAGLLARNANRAGPDAQALGEDLAGAGLQGRGAVPRRGRPAAGAGEARLRHRRLRLHHLQRHVRRARPGDPAGDHRPRPVRDRGAVRQPQLRRPHPPVCEAGLPRLAAAGGRVCHRRHHPLRHREGRARPGRERQADPAQGHLAERRGDRRDRRRQREAGAVPQGLRADVRAQAAGRHGR